MAKQKAHSEDFEAGKGSEPRSRRDHVFLDSGAGLGALAQEQGAALLKEIKLALQEIRPQLVSEALNLARILRAQAAHGEPLLDLEESWEPVGSLSQLRMVVGGRYSNLKLKWTGAGFPLRAHRGDREEEAEIIPEGWLQLAEWIRQQGFDARLTPGSPRGMFEVRKLGV